jgi:hypothetical protein
MMAISNWSRQQIKYNYMFLQISQWKDYSIIHSYSKCNVLVAYDKQ